MNHQTMTTKKQMPSEAEAQTTSTEFLNGPDPRGPAKCFMCHQPFKSGETWRRMTSPENPEYGAFNIGIHDRCVETGD